MTASTQDNLLNSQQHLFLATALVLAEEAGTSFRAWAGLDSSLQERPQVLHGSGECFAGRG